MLRFQHVIVSIISAMGSVFETQRTFRKGHLQVDLCKLSSAKKHKSVLHPAGALLTQQDA